MNQNLEIEDETSIQKLIKEYQIELKNGFERFSFGDQV